MTKHQDIAIGYVHVPYNWTYADATARTADTSGVAADIGKFARQLDDNTIWMLTAITPTWVAVGGASGGGDSLVLTLTNQVGSTVNLGDVVYLDDSSVDSFNRAAVARYEAYAFGVVVDASIVNGAAGRVCMGGYVSQINLTASASIGSHIYNSGSVAGQGTPQAAAGFGSGFPWDEGHFAIALESGTTPSAFIFNPPISMGERLLVKNKSLNMNTGTAITLYTVPTGRTCVITKFIFRDPTASLTTVSFSVGWNSASFNNVLANATHTELTGSGLYTLLFPKIGAATGAAAGILKLLNNTLQGSGATLFCEIYGYLF